jgi:DNA-binding phage protein
MLRVGLALDAALVRRDTIAHFPAVLISCIAAYRGVKDLVKLAKLTKEPVTVSIKEAGKPRQDTVVNYGDAPGSGLSSAEEYATRAADELLGATLALDAAIKYMAKP